MSSPALITVALAVKQAEKFIFLDLQESLVGVGKKAVIWILRFLRIVIVLSDPSGLPQFVRPQNMEV